MLVGVALVGGGLAGCGRSNDSSGHNTFDSQSKGVNPDSTARDTGQGAGRR